MKRTEYISQLKDDIIQEMRKMDGSKKSLKFWVEFNRSRDTLQKQKLKDLGDTLDMSREPKGK